MKYCNQCGGTVEARIPVGDNRSRYVCVTCDIIHYQNPKMVAGCVVNHQGKILLCKRAIEPRKGYWTIPAGFMENEESLPEAAARECLEEALAPVEIQSLLAVVSLPYAHQVHIMFRAHLAQPIYGVGEESLEVGLYHPDDSPWADIAFPSVEYALRQYLADQARGVQDVHVTDIERPAWRTATIV